MRSQPPAQTHLPVVEGAAPQLARVGEGVGGHARDFHGRAVWPQREQCAVGPDIRGLAAHVYGHVPDQQHAPIVGVGLDKGCGGWVGV